MKGSQLHRERGMVEARSLQPRYRIVSAERMLVASIPRERYMTVLFLALLLLLSTTTAASSLLRLRI